MSDRIEGQIRRMVEVIDRELPPITVDELNTMLEQQVAAAVGRRLSGPLVAVAVAVIVLVLGGGLALLFNNPDEIQPADTVVTTLVESTPTTVVEGTTPTPTTIPQGSPQMVVLPPRLEVEVIWTEVEVPSTKELWSGGDGPSPWGIEAGSNVILGGGDGVLWSSEDGETWEPIFSDLTDFSIAVDGPVAVVAGTRNDGTSALFISDNGKTWTEVDHSTLPKSGRLQVVETTRSGLTWFYTERQPLRGGPGVLATISEGRLVDVHNPPWDTEDSRRPELLETSSGIAATQAEFNRLPRSHAWSYLGSGQWSQPVEIPISSDHLRVGDTVLMIDHANATCCGDPIPGESHWPFLASNDGVNWTEISRRAASTAYPLVGGFDRSGVHSLQLAAGESFWVYGPQIGGGGDGIEVDEFSTLWISTNATDWQPLDIEFSIPTNAGLGFLRADGDVIFVHFDDSPDGTPTIGWVGKVKTG